MELVSTRGERAWIDFSDPPTEKETQFMMEHFGFPNTDHLSDDECEELIYQSELKWLSEEMKREIGVDANDPNNYDEYGHLKVKPATEYGLMIAGMGLYIANQFHAGTRKWKSQKAKS